VSVENTQASPMSGNIPAAHDEMTKKTLTENPKRKIILAINIGQREYKHKHSSGTKLFQRVVAQLPISCIIDVFIH